jgi:GTP-binding protein HflX
VFATDTVGFVRKLPHQLVTAFATTLDVVRDADLLVHVVDGSGPDPIGSMAAVRSVLEDIGAADVPELLVFNKADQSDQAFRLADKFEGSVAVSAHTGLNLEHLLGLIGDRLRSLTELAEVMIPWDRGDVIASVHREGQVLAERSDSDGMWMKVRLEPASLGALRHYLVGESAVRADSQLTEEDDW